MLLMFSIWAMKSEKGVFVHEKCPTGITNIMKLEIRVFYYSVLWWEKLLNWWWLMHQQAALKEASPAWTMCQQKVCKGLCKVLYYRFMRLHLKKKKEKEKQIKGSITLSFKLNMFLFSSVFHTYNMRSQPKNNNKVWNGSRLANCSWLWNSTRALGDLFVAEHSSLKLVSGPVLAGVSKHNPRRNSGLSSFIPHRPCSQNRVWLWNIWWVSGYSVYTFTPNPSIYSFVL